jgi:hypothetical protein
MEQLMHEVRRTALDNDLGMDNELASQTVLKMLIDGDEGERAFALALMEGDPGLAQVDQSRPQSETRSRALSSTTPCWSRRAFSTTGLMSPAASC